MALLLFTGLYLTIRLKGLQFTQLPRAIRYIFEKEEGKGDVSSFASLCTALAATIGTGSIVGVATALRAGGPGALFWMWVSALLGMATKYAEGLLAVRFRMLWMRTGRLPAVPCTILRGEWEAAGSGWRKCLHSLALSLRFWDAEPFPR